MWIKEGNGNDQRGPAWGAWANLGHGSYSLQNGKVAAAAERDQQGTIHAFARDSVSPNWLWHASRYGATGAFAWESWSTPCGSGTMSEPDALSIAPGVVEVWVVCNPGPSGTLWHKKVSYGNAPGSWIQLGTAAFAPSSGPAVVTWGDGSRRDLFFQGNGNHHLIHAYAPTPAAYYYEDLGLPSTGATIESSPDAASWQQSRLDVVWRDSNNQIGHWYWDATVNPMSPTAGWNLWSLGAPSGVDLTGGSAPTITQLGDNRLNVLVATSAGAMYLSPWLDGVDGGWVNYSGTTHGTDLTSW